MVPRRLSPGRSSAMTRPWRSPLRPHATPCHWHTGMDWLPQDANPLDGSLFMCALKDKSAARSVALLVEALWVSGRDGSTGVAPAEQHTTRRKVKTNGNATMGFIIDAL
ncbi:hypothetical protein GQ55_1G085000 [Panicum hallii var. hallii]|uniref:Uncharacterized protein n=1 Tax=Panicum hallii var. hallii TaxID=1504633 RepID=A0A2T7F3N9_9POAL|nr:hypothetical protein GQ55_1G085000 [Panicum hallii var. hallii]